MYNLLTIFFYHLAAYPLGIRVHALDKQFHSPKDKKLDYYELHDEAENEFDDYDSGDDVDSNDRGDHDAVDDKEYADDYDDNNDLEDEVNDHSFDKVDNNHEDDDYEMSDGNGVEIEFSAPTKASLFSAADEDEDDEISGYRPDVALTSPLEYYS